MLKLPTPIKNVEFSKPSKKKGGFSYEFNIYKFMTWPSGLWPLEKHNPFIRLRYLLATSSQMFILTTSLIEIYRKCGNPADVLDYYAIAVVFFLSFARLVFAKMHLSAIHENIYNARKDWLSIESPNLTKIMIDHAKIGKKFCRIQLSLSFPVVILYVVNPIILPRYEASNLPLQTVCTFNNISTITCTSIYIFESVGFLYLPFGVIGTDVLFAGLVMHLCGQLAILPKLFGKIGEATYPFDCISYIILLSKRYGKVVKLMSNVEKAFSEMLMITFVMNFFLITSQSVTLLIALKVKNYFLAYKSLQSFPLLMIQMFIYCYTGELLKYAVEDIGRAACNSQWYLVPPKIRQGYLLAVMVQTSKSFYLTAGKMIRANMATYINFVRSIVSFFSILLLMFDTKH